MHEETRTVEQNDNHRQDHRTVGALFLVKDGNDHTVLSFVRHFFVDWLSVDKVNRETITVTVGLHIATLLAH